MSKKIVILASGQGSTFAALVAACKSGEIAAAVSLLVVSRPQIGAIDEAERLGVPWQVLRPVDFASREVWDKHLTEVVSGENPAFVLLAGFGLKLGGEFLKKFARQTLNSHPSLLPKYGGQGMYGDRIHAAVLAAGEKETGVSIHWVTDDYDSGPILAQEKVMVEPGDTVETLSARVKAREKVLYIQSVAKLVRE